MAYRDTILADTPLMYLELENNVTDTQAFTGTTAGSISYVAGKVGQAGSAAGTMVTLNSTNSYFNSRVFSVEFWVKWTSTSSQTFFNRGSSLPGLKILSNSSGNIQVNASGNSNQITLVSPAAYNNGAWHHVVYVMESASSSKLYVDGSLVASDTTTNVGSTMNMTGSATIGASGNSFQLDEFAIYSSALTSTKVTNHYNGANVTSANYNAQAATASATMPGGGIPFPVTVSVPVATASADMPGGVAAVKKKNIAQVWAEVNSAATTTNSNTQTQTVTDMWSNSTHDIYVSLDMSTIPSTATIAVAELTLAFTGSEGTGSRKVSARKITSSFDPTTVTWATKPSIDAVEESSYSQASGGIVIGTTTTLKVTEAAKAVLNGSGYGVALVATTAGFQFATPDNATTAYRPVLTVTYYDAGNKVVTTLPLTASAAMVDAVAAAGHGATNVAAASTASATIVAPVASSDLLVVANIANASAMMADAIAFTPDRNVQAAPALASAQMPGGAYSAAVSVAGNPATANAAAVDITVATEHNAIISAGVAVSTATMIAPLQGQGNETDAYYKRLQQVVGTNYTWLRLDETSGTNAKGEGTSPSGTYVGGPTFNVLGPENRKAVHFDGVDDYVKLPDTDGYIIGGSMEVTFRTTKANCDIVGGVDYVGPTNFAGPLRASVLGLRNGRVYTRPNYELAFTGRTNLADGQWHHLVMIVDGTTGVAGAYPGRLSIYVDGVLELRRWLTQTQQFTVIPDVLGGGFGTITDVTYPSGINGFTDLAGYFEGDIMEYMFTPNELSENDALEDYYAAFGITPVRAQAATAYASMSNATGKGNQKRALMLYYNSSYDANFGHAFGGNLDYNWTGLRFQQGSSILPDPRKPFDFEGYKVFGQNILAGTNTNGYLGGTFYDEVTGEPRYIDISVDMDMSQYDMVFFLDLPPKDTAVERSNFERMANGVLTAQREYGFSLWVPQPDLAVALGIIDRVESHSMLRGTRDGRAVANTPFDLAPEKNGVYDTHSINKYRITATVDGLTDIGGWLLKDYAYSLPYGGQNFDVPIEAWNWEEKPNGLQIGDEMYFHIDFFWTSGSASYLTGGGAYARYDVVSVPAEHVKAGTIVAKEIATYWDDNTQKENPWKDYATVISLEPGDTLNGQPVGGKIFVNFMESPAAYLVQNKRQIVPPNELIADPDARETEAMRDWEYSSFRISRQRQSVGGSIGPISDNLPAGSDEMAKYLDWLALSAIRGGGTNLFQVIENQKYAVETLPFYNMSDRGFIWMADRVEVADGDKVIRTTAATASANVVQPTVTVEKDAKVAVQASLANAQIVNPAEVHSPDAAVMVLPATAQAVMTGYGKYISVTPATAVATIVENFDLVHAGGEQIVLYLHYSDVTVYMKEDA